ncbi:unnamed protein product [Symbiodinium natans]|uniref:Uncharacterized protein n=1 Tax=Symbiodinium natans TaxID=878477 RepID=A0A812IPK7_9DINO|nr:unnamed protein product [Symbiodinium natans]
MRSHRSIPKQKHVKRVSRLAQLLPRLRSCCQGDCAGIVHFLAAVRPGETDPYMLKVGKSTLCMQEHNSRANGCLGRALRRYKHCAVEKASGWRAMKVLLFTHEAHAPGIRKRIPLHRLPDILARSTGLALTGKSTMEPTFPSSFLWLTAFSDSPELSSCRCARRPGSTGPPTAPTSSARPSHGQPCVVTSARWRICRIWQEWQERGLPVLRGNDIQYPLNTLFRKCRGKLWKPAVGRSPTEPARFQPQFLIRFDALRPDLEAKLRTQLKMPLEVTEPVVLRRPAANTGR